MVKRLVAFILVSASAWCGQSIVTTTGSYPVNYGISSVSHNTPVRIEIQFHDWDSAGGYEHICHAYGSYSQFIGASYLYFTSYWDTSNYAYPIPLPATRYVNLRAQRDPVAMTQSVEAWDRAGNLIYQKQTSITDQSDASGGCLVGAANVSTAFYRVFTSLVPLGSRPPVTADNSGALLNWKFDGNLNDSGSSGYSASMSSGSASYTSTPYQSPVATVKVAGGPTWWNTPTLRAGASNQLDCSSSYSQGDAGYAVNCSWNASGPSAVTFDDALSATPNITGLVFGEYTFGLTVTDVGANSASSSTKIGAVAADSNWVVQPSDARITKFFGPMMALYRSSWGWADYAQTVMSRNYSAYLQAAPYNLSLTYPYATWESPLAGTVSYTWPAYGQSATLTGVGTSFLTTLCPGGTPASGRSVVLHFNRPLDGTDAYTDWTIASCSSNTVATITSRYDPNGYEFATNAAITGQSYSYVDNISNYYNQSPSGGVGFYGPDLGDLSAYLRSGLTEFRDRAWMLGDIWVKMRGKCQGSPLWCGGYMVGGFANAVFGTSGHSVQWKDLRPYALQGVAAIAGTNPGTGGTCASADSRGIGYQFASVALAALFDPDTTSSVPDGQGGGWKGYWNRQLQTMYTVENACRQADNSWASGGDRWGNTGVAITFTNGSNIGTGVNIPQSSNASAKCYGIAAGSGTATNGSSTINGSGFVDGHRIAISGTKSGSPFTMWVYYTYVSSSQVSINYGTTWQGDSGSITWMVDNSASPIVFANSVDDASLKRTYSCMWLDSGRIQLMRPWNSAWDGNVGTGVNTYTMYTYTVAGYAQQPYMLGIRQMAWRWAALAATDAGNPTLAANFNSLRYAAGTWAYASAFDRTVTNGFYYSTHHEMCNPIYTASMGEGVCYSGNPPSGAYGVTAERELTAENSASLMSYWESTSGSAAAKTWGDLAYGGLWGVSGYNSGGVYNSSDQYNEASSNGATNSCINLGSSSCMTKWYGFFWGMGMAHQWPALRAGSSSGGSNAVTRTTGGRIITGGRILP